MSFGLYAIGFAIVIGGLIYAAYLVHAPTQWIIVGAIVLLGIGILTGVKATRQKDWTGYRDTDAAPWPAARGSTSVTIPRKSR